MGTRVKYKRGHSSAGGGWKEERETILFYERGKEGKNKARRKRRKKGVD